MVEPSFQPFILASHILRINKGYCTILALLLLLTIVFLVSQHASYKYHGIIDKDIFFASALLSIAVLPLPRLRRGALVSVTMQTESL